MGERFGSNNRKMLVTISLFLLVAEILTAQKFVFEQITSLDGLPENYINTIYQDRNGFIWMGTHDGFCRYDGLEFKNFNIDKERKDWLNSSLIRDISGDNFGNICITTADQGIFLYDQIIDSFRYIGNPQNINSLMPKRIQTTLMRGNDLFVGSVTGMIKIHLNKTAGFPVEFEEVKDISNVYHFLPDDRNNDDRIWIGTEDGLYLYNNSLDGKWTIKNFSKTGSNEITYMIPYQKGLLVSSQDGIYYFDEFRGFNKVINHTVNNLLIDNEGMLWTSSGDGLTVFKRDSSPEMSFTWMMEIEEGSEIHNITSRLITELFLDHTGIVWIGTQNGLNKYNSNRKKFTHYSKNSEEGSLSSNSIRAIKQDSEGNIWIGTNGGGINFLSSDRVIEKDFEKFLCFPVNLEGNKHDAYCIEEVTIDDQSYFIVGTSVPQSVEVFMLTKDGRPVKKPLFKQFEEVEGDVYAIASDNDYIWFGTYSDGLIRYEKQTDKLMHISKSSGHMISSDVIRDILIDENNNLWVATGRGLNFLPAFEKGDQNLSFKTFNHVGGDTTSLIHDYVLTLFESSSGDIWIGTMGGGLCKYMGRGVFITYDTKDGLPNNVIKGIQEDDHGNLWISSNKGLSKFNPETKAISNYDLYDGLQDHEFGEHASAKMSDGEMLFGGFRGITAFYPDDIKNESTIPNVVFTDFMVLNSSVGVGEKVRGKVVLTRNINETSKVRLKFSDNSFTIFFSGLHYSVPTKNQYKYFLEGYSHEWIITDASNNSAKYTNLSPGHYTFKVMASNNDGVWNPKSKKLEIHIVPPFWYSWPALLFYMGTFIGLVFFFRRYTFIRIREKHRLLMEQFKQEKLEELSKMKLRFYTNISHEFRTPLTLIIGPVKRLLQQYDSLPAAKNKQLLQIIFKNSATLLKLINQLMDFRKVEQDKMELTVSEGNFYLNAKEIYESFKELAFQKNIDYKFSSYSKDISLWYDDEIIEKIFYNLLSNAFKYTPEGGNVSFIINNYGQDFIEIRIEDSGVGISESARKHIFKRFYNSKTIVDREVGSTGIGLSLSKSLVDLHKGQIDFESSPGNGCAFFVRFKKGDAHFTIIEKDNVQPAIRMRKQEIEFFPKELATQRQDVQKPKVPTPKLLIAEDNVDLRNFLQDSFTSDFQVEACEDGLKAFERIDYFEPDLIISDVMMPQMDGFELCRKVKTNESTSHIPIILLSAKTTETDQIIGYNMGADAYVPKPFDLDVLLAQIKAILRMRCELQKKFKENIDISPSEVAMTAMDEKFLGRICKIIEENMVDPYYSVSRLSSDYGMTQKLLNKKLKVLTGLTAKSFIRSIRMKRAAQLLNTGKYSVSEVTYDVGFSDLKYFRSCFKEEFNVTPSDYKKLNQKIDKD